MENNLFTNIRFGDKYVTRSGKKCVIISVFFHYTNLIGYMIDGDTSCTWCDSNGRVDIENECNEDIVTKWKEPITEKILNKLAKNTINDLDNNNWFGENNLDKESYYYGFKKGYYQAFTENLGFNNLYNMCI